jgi:hypothetical protein
MKILPNNPYSYIIPPLLEDDSWILYSNSNFTCDVTIFLSSYPAIQIKIKNTTNHWKVGNQSLYSSEPITMERDNNSTLSIESIEPNSYGEFYFSLCSDRDCTTHSQVSAFTFLYLILSIFGGIGCIVFIILSIIYLEKRKRRKKDRTLFQKHISNQISILSLDDISNIQFTHEKNHFHALRNHTTPVSLHSIESPIYLMKCWDYQITHPNWVCIQGVYQNEYFHFLVTEKLNGSLKEWLDGVHWTGEEDYYYMIIDLGIDILKALICGETLGLSFHEFCIDNIMMSEYNQIKLIHRVPSPWKQGCVYGFGMVMMSMMQWKQEEISANIKDRPIYCPESLWNLFLSCVVREVEQRPDLFYLNRSLLFYQKPKIQIIVQDVPLSDHYESFIHYKPIAGK